MGKNVRGIMMENGEAEDGVKQSNQMQGRIRAELKGSEIQKCNEQRDIRDKVVSGNPFVGSAVKRRTAELKGSEHGNAGSDPDLNADTTLPSDNKITKAPQAKDEFAGSSKRRNQDEQGKKRTYFEGTARNKQTNS